MKKNGFSTIVLLLGIAVIVAVTLYIALKYFNKKDLLILTEEGISTTTSSLMWSNSIRLKITNNSNKSITINVADFSLVDTKNNVVGKLAVNGREPALPVSKILNPGETVNGYVTFSDTYSNFVGTLRYSPKNNGQKTVEIPVNFNLPVTM